VTLAMVGLLAGCATKAKSLPAPPGLVSAPPVVRVQEVAREHVDEASSCEELALLAPSVAPGMREIERGESPLPASIALPPRETDVCLRAVFASSSAIVAALVDDAGRALEVSEAGKNTLLAAQGPVCLNKDHSAHIEVQGPRGLVRYVVWITP
jgi:hypothetical protein